MAHNANAHSIDPTIRGFSSYRASSRYNLPDHSGKNIWVSKVSFLHFSDLQDLFLP